MSKIGETASVKLVFSINLLLPSAKIKAIHCRDHIFSVEVDLNEVPPPDMIGLLERQMASIDEVKLHEMIGSNAAQLFLHHGQDCLAAQCDDHAGELVTVAQYKNFYAPVLVNALEDGVYKILGFTEIPGGVRIQGLAARDKQVLKKVYKHFEAGKGISYQNLGGELFFFAPDCLFTPKGAIVFDQYLKLWHALNDPSVTYSHIEPALAHAAIFKHLDLSEAQLPLTLAELRPVESVNNNLNSLLESRFFTHDTTHIFTTEDRAVEEITSSLLFIEKTFMMLDFEVQWHLTADSHPPARTRTSWKQGVQMLKDALQAADIKWEPRSLNHDTHGPAAYITVPDALGQRWEVGALALNLITPTDQQLQYRSTNGQMHTPIMIMRSLFFSVERIMALQLENKNGLLPTWLAPEQVRILPLAERHQNLAKTVLSRLIAAGVRVEMDPSTDPLNARIHAAEAAKVPWMVVIGDQELQNDSIAVRRCGDPKPRVGVKWEEFLSEILGEINPPAEQIRSYRKTKG